MEHVIRNCKQSLSLHLYILARIVIYSPHYENLNASAIVLSLTVIRRLSLQIKDKLEGTQFIF